MNPSSHAERHRAGWVWLDVALVACALTGTSCNTRHAVEVAPTHHTVKVEPIHMTVDVNLRVQQELDRFYGDVVDDGGEPEPEGEDAP